MAERSAALALLRLGVSGAREVLLVHPGGPFWAKRDLGAWSLPKGHIEAGEEPAEAARREFFEETGTPAPLGALAFLGEVTMKRGKTIVGFAASGDFDVTQLKSNEVEVEFPARSGRRLRFPEVDRAVWADLERARQLVHPSQVPLIERALSS